MFRVVLPPDIIAFAMITAENRPKHIAVHNPSVDPDADLIGALTEHAWAYKYHIPQSAVTWNASGGDGGIDFHMAEGTIDLKASGKYPTSWVIKKGPLRSQWYVFATVQLPDTVTFKGKARREDIAQFPMYDIVGGNRLIHLERIDDIAEGDFSRREE